MRRPLKLGRRAAAGCRGAGAAAWPFGAILTVGGEPSKISYDQAKQPKSGTGVEGASRDNLDLPPLTSDEVAWDRACDALLNARLITKFGPKLEFT